MSATQAQKNALWEFGELVKDLREVRAAVAHNAAQVLDESTRGALDMSAARLDRLAARAEKFLAAANPAKVSRS